MEFAFFIGIGEGARQSVEFKAQAGGGFWQGVQQDKGFLDKTGAEEFPIIFEVENVRELYSGISAVNGGMQPLNRSPSPR